MRGGGEVRKVSKSGVERSWGGERCGELISGKRTGAEGGMSGDWMGGGEGSVGVELSGVRSEF